MGLSVEDGEGDGVLRVKSAQTFEAITPATINRTLVKEGIAVSLVKPEQSGLESLYRELMEAPRGAVKEQAI